MVSASEESEWYQHEIPDDQQHRRQRHSAHDEDGVAREKHERSGPAQQTNAGWPRE
jgi:hypothetical protein